jgi:predicted O-methyltransferase YrrM
MTDYKFTQDWFSHNIPVWEQLATLLPERKSFLEIGSFEGRSAVWIIENMMNPGDWIDCVDTWEGSEEHKNGELSGAEDRFIYNIDVALGGAEVEERDAERKFPYPTHTRYASPAPNEGGRKKVYRYECTSTQYLGSKLGGYDNKNLFNFIYIDGSHIAKDVLTDACMAWPLLKQGGLLVFDDYLWGESRDILHRPRLAVDFFVNIFAESLDIVHIGHQFVVRKK